VPISKKAFMPGKLVNTNEILVLLGDNWFVERSAKQATEMIDRRVVSIDTHVEEINREIGFYRDQINWTKNLINVKFFKNINDMFCTVYTYFSFLNLRVYF
jgi:unconventional prefoldin RPB5 interactor 1